MKKPESALPIGNKRTRPLRDVGGEEIDLSSPTVMQLVKLIYGRERSRWETLKAGEQVSYVFPKRYDGEPPKTIEHQLVLEKGTKSEWVRLTKWLQEHGIPAAPFMSLVFDHLMTTEKRAPEPYQLRTKKYLRLWNKYKDRAEERIRLALVSQNEVAARHTAAWRTAGRSSEDAWVIVLTNLGLELSPLFRYCVASALGGKRFRRIAARFHADAIMQFERYRKFYLAHWDFLLPKGFASGSRRAYPHLLSR